MSLVRYAIYMFPFVKAAFNLQHESVSKTKPDDCSASKYWPSLNLIKENQNMALTVDMNLFKFADIIGMNEVNDATFFQLLWQVAK